MTNMTTFKDYLKARSGATRSKAISKAEAEILGIDDMSKGWPNRYATKEYDDDTIYRALNAFLSSNTKKNKGWARDWIHKMECTDAADKDPKHPESYVYLFKNEVNRYKIGVSVNPSRRVQAIRNQSGMDMWIITYWSVEGDAYDVERSLHSSFKGMRGIGEWFDF